VPEVADRRRLALSAAEPLRLRTRSVGLFLFLPLLARLGFDELVREAGYAGSRMVPADAAVLSLLTLKLLTRSGAATSTTSTSTRRRGSSPG
jgi:hypothetical protein